MAENSASVPAESSVLTDISSLLSSAVRSSTLASPIAQLLHASITGEKTASAETRFYGWLVGTAKDAMAKGRQRGVNALMTAVLRVTDAMPDQVRDMALERLAKEACTDPRLAFRIAAVKVLDAIVEGSAKARTRGTADVLGMIALVPQPEEVSKTAFQALERFEKIPEPKLSEARLNGLKATLLVYNQD